MEGLSAFLQMQNNEASARVNMMAILSRAPYPLWVKQFVGQPWRIEIRK